MNSRHKILVDGDLAPQIALVYIDLVTPDAIHCLDYHLGLGFLRAYLAANGIAVVQLVSSEPISFSALVSALLLTEAPILGFTVYDTNYHVVREIARAIKDKEKNRTIVIGGPAATFSDHFILNDASCIDVCVRGHGEEITLALIRALQRREDLHSIGGISFKAESHFVSTPLNSRCASKGGSELDRYPSPYLTGAIPSSAGPRIGLLSSRGCKYRCSFCNFATMSEHYLSYHSVLRFVAELELMLPCWTPGQMVHIHDDAFTNKIGRLKELCRAIIERGLNQMTFTCNGRIDHLDEEAFHLLKEANIRPHFGLESANPKVLRNIHKIGGSTKSDRTFTKEQKFLDRLRRKVVLAKSCGLTDLSTSIILGLPGEDEAAGSESVKFVESLGIKEYAHNHLQIYAGTELSYTHAAYGIGLQAGPYGLPRGISYAYDVYQVKPVESASQVRIARRELDLLAGLLTGVFSTTTYHYALFDSDTCSLDRSRVFLHDVLPLGSELCVTARKWERGKKDDFQRSLAREHLVAPRIRLIETFDTTDMQSASRMRARFSFLHDDECTSRFIPLDIFLVSTIERTFSGGLFLSLTTDADSSAMDQLLSAPRIEIPLQNFESGPVRIVDQCRWVSAPCPAPSGVRYLCQNNSIRPCFHGEEIGTTETNCESITRRTLERMARSAESRGCERCSASAHCSRCMFLGMVNVRSYCSLKRKYANGHFVFHLLEDLSTLLTAEACRPDRPVGVRAERVIILRGSRPDVFFVSWGLLGFVRYAADKRIFERLSATIREVVESLARGLTSLQLAKDFSTRLNVDMPEITRLFEHLEDTYAVPITQRNFNPVETHDQTESHPAFFTFLDQKRRGNRVPDARDKRSDSRTSVLPQ